MQDLSKGGFLKGKKTYVTTGLGILTAIGTYAVGEMDLATLIQTIFPLAGLFFVRKGLEDK